MLTVREALLKAKKILKDADIETYSLDAALILCYVYKIDRARIILLFDTVIKPDTEEYFFKLVKRRADRVPLSYITGIKEFMGLEFKVNESVLIPRPDTEILVESLLKELHNEKNPTIIDVGTGSGAIAVSLAYYLKYCKVIAIDISKEALNIAYENAKKYNVLDKIEFVQSDLFKNFNADVIGLADAIISNPPYIPSNVIENLQMEVKFEPHIALDGGIDGLDFYRNIVNEGRKFLKTNGIMAFEVGFNEAEDVVKIMKDFNTYIVKDLSDIDRIVVGRTT